VGVGHLSAGITDKAKFNQLLSAFMNKAELTLGQKLKINVRFSKPF